jgi:hypothetical protein
LRKSGLSNKIIEKVFNFSLYFNLVELEMSQNELEIVKSDYFSKNNQMTYLNLSHNRIYLIEKGSMFNGLTLDLSFNSLKHFNKEYFVVSSLNDQEIV